MKGTAAPTPEGTDGRSRVRRIGVNIDVHAKPAWPVPTRRPVAADPLAAADASIRAEAALSLTETLLASPALLPEIDQARIAAQVPDRLPASAGRERAALLALAAVLSDHLTPEGRAMVRAAGTDEADLPLAVVAQLCALVVEDFPISDTLLGDLAGLVGTPTAVGVIAQRGPIRDRALRLVLAAARA
jgi:hypothetical protein